MSFETPTNTVESRPSKESLLRKIEMLRSELEAYKIETGVNVTGQTLVEADATAKSLMDAETALATLTSEEHRERNALPDGGIPEQYPSQARMVGKSMQQYQAPAQREQTNVANLNQAPNANAA